MNRKQDDMGHKIQERVNFKTIRYANCWEDADTLLQALEVKENGVYLSVASAGDNAFSILSKNPSLVIAVDISGAQLACVELRKAAFLALSYEELLPFLGIADSSDRINTYKKIRTYLSSDARSFWDTHEQFIKKGIIHAGKFENYFRLFRNWILPLIHNKKTVSTLLERMDAVERTAFYTERWNTLPWQIFFRIFFSRRVMGWLGRDSEFFTYVKGDVANRIMERAEYGLTVLPTHENPYLEYIITGIFKKSLPHYLHKSNYELIRKNLDKLILFKGGVIEALHAHNELKFDGFNLSDIFEYMSYSDYIDHLRQIIHFSRKEARLVYWNMLAERRSPADFKNRLEVLDDFAKKLFSYDKAFFYKALIIEKVL
jgi:S-adenosylmethionine-diacylglycerol 3-amino-3-carboxypropyl transferase